jgi:hypothetical protein
VRSRVMVAATCVWCSTPPPKTRASPGIQHRPQPVARRMAGVDLGIGEGSERQQVGPVAAGELDAGRVVAAGREGDPAGEHRQQGALGRGRAEEVEAEGAVLMPAVRRVAGRGARGAYWRRTQHWSRSRASASPRRDRRSRPRRRESSVAAIPRGRAPRRRRPEATSCAD